MLEFSDVTNNESNTGLIQKFETEHTLDDLPHAGCPTVHTPEKKRKSPDLSPLNFFYRDF